VIRKAQRHCWRGLMAHIRRQSLMDAAEIVVRNIQAHGRHVVLQLLAEPVRQSREAPGRHADRTLAYPMMAMFCAPILQLTFANHNPLISRVQDFLAKLKSFAKMLAPRQPPVGPVEVPADASTRCTLARWCAARARARGRRRAP
jgi:hypothetical protein